MTPERLNRGQTIIESLGVYLPPREVSTEEVLHGCRKKVRFPLERLTGIKSRHVAGETEFAIDLAKQAIARCLAMSRHGPADVDLLISTCIARVDGPDFQVSYEPSTALRLKQHFGFDRAMTFDIRNACSGMFTAIQIVDTLIQQGVIERGLVVSGEYITHLTTTAQIEIEDLLDSRLACLTLGDSGAAVLLEAAAEDGVGLAAIDLCTLGEYAKYCIAGPTDEAHGGAIMFTDALKLTDAGARHGSDHALATLHRAGWPSDAFDHVIMHQTSRTALTSAMRAINQVMRRRVCHQGNTIDNLERRGNTATTTHFVALDDGIRNGRIRSGDRVIFAISASGLTVGTALYTLDDLPERLMGAKRAARSNGNGADRPPVRAVPSAKVRIASVGIGAPTDGESGQDSMTLLERAGTDCLRRWGRDRHELNLLIYGGTYRTRFVTEPAIAALLAGSLDVNGNPASLNGKRTFAFDVFNGGVAVLNACYVAAQMMSAGKAVTAMIATAETENNARNFPAELLGIEETGSALLLDSTSEHGEGFGAFAFRSYPEPDDAFVSHLTNREGKTYLRFSRRPDLEQRYVRAIVETVEEFLRSERVEISHIARIFPPQISSAFIAELSRAMQVPNDRFVDAVRGGRDLFTSSLPYALRHARDNGLVASGDVGLFIGVGSGLQVGCALYTF